MEAWLIPLVNEELFDYAPVVARNFTYKMTDGILNDLYRKETQMQLRIFSNVEVDMAIKMIYNPLIINVKTGTLLAALILLIFYALLVWEVSFQSHTVLLCVQRNIFIFSIVFFL